MEDFPPWAPSSLVKFYHDHIGFLPEADVAILDQLLRDPEMKLLWREVMKRAPGREYSVYFAILTQLHLSKNLKTIPEIIQERKDLNESIRQLRRTLARVCPGLMTSDGKRTLLQELDQIGTKVSIDKVSLLALSALPERRSEHVERNAFIKAMAQLFKQLLGTCSYRQVVRLTNVVLRDSIDMATVRDVLKSYQKANKANNTNPLDVACDALISEMKAGERRKQV